MQPLSDCVDKVLDNNNYEYSEKDILPKNLCFERTVYSSLLDKIGILDNEIIAKVVQYYSETKDIEEEFEKVKNIHDAPYSFIKYLMTQNQMDRIYIQSKNYKNTQEWSEIEYSLRHAKQVYDLGKELIT